MILFLYTNSDKTGPYTIKEMHNIGTISIFDILFVHLLTFHFLYSP
jgi:hypothetical protein